MKFAILAPAAVIVATLVVSTSAASTAPVLRNGGIICQALPDRVVCSKANHTGYVVRFSDSVVIVEKEAGNAKVIFSVPQYNDGVGINKLPAQGPTNMRATHVFCEQSWVDYGGTTEYGLGCKPQRTGGYYFVMTKHVLMVVDVRTSSPVFTRRLP